MIILKMSETCAVCLEPLEENTYTVPECNHIFHQNCIIECYRRLGSDCGCPICRSSPEYETSWRSKRERVKLYKKIARRKSCPQIIKNLCQKHIQCNKDRLINDREARQFKQKNQDIFSTYRKLRTKSFKNVSKRRKIEKEIEALPLIFLLHQISQ